jgi:hypothetical protein
MTRLLRDPTPDPRLTPRSALTREHWWIVVVEQVGRTAIPGRKLAHQAKEVCRGVGLKVLKVRPAVVTDPGDLVAIEQSRAELKDAQLRLAVIAGALPGARLNGQKETTIAAPY